MRAVWGSLFFLSLIWLGGVRTQAQFVPLGSGLEDGVRILVFAADDCDICEPLAAVADVPVVHVGWANAQPPQPHGYEALADEGGLLARSLFVQRAPTAVILRNGQEVVRYENDFDLEALQRDLAAVGQGVLMPRYPVNLRIGEQLTGRFADHTGLIVFWKQDCEWCEREEADVAALCEGGRVAVTVVAVTLKEWPEACNGLHETETYDAWNIPGAPTHVYLEGGRVIWIALGYRPDVREIVEALLRWIGERL